MNGSQNWTSTTSICSCNIWDRGREGVKCHSRANHLMKKSLQPLRYYLTTCDNGQQSKYYTKGYAQSDQIMSNLWPKEFNKKLLTSASADKVHNGMKSSPILPVQVLVGFNPVFDFLFLFLLLFNIGVLLFSSSRKSLRCLGVRRGLNCLSLGVTWDSSSFRIITSAPVWFWISLLDAIKQMLINYFQMKDLIHTTVYYKKWWQWWVCGWYQKYQQLSPLFLFS